VQNFYLCLSFCRVHICRLSVIYYGRNAYAWKAIIFCRGSFFLQTLSSEVTGRNVSKLCHIIGSRLFLVVSRQHNIFGRKCDIDKRKNRFYIMKTPYMFSKFDERLIILTNCVHGTWHEYSAAVSLQLPRVAVCLVGWITMPETKSLHCKSRWTTTSVYLHELKMHYTNGHHVTGLFTPPSMKERAIKSCYVTTNRL